MSDKKTAVVDWCEILSEPEGWDELQERAQSERDPRKLEAIIAEMNALLSECEKSAANGSGGRPTSRRSNPNRIVE
jgi:hypothetical protein